MKDTKAIIVVGLWYVYSQGLEVRAKYQQVRTSDFGRLSVQQAEVVWTAGIGGQ